LAFAGDFFAAFPARPVLLLVLRLVLLGALAFAVFDFLAGLKRGVPPIMGSI
jgi:hypothetical protein